MKKVLLAIVMVFALCGCGKTEKSDVIRETVADNMGQKSEYSTADSKNTQKAKYDLVVEDCKMKIFDEHTFSIKAKVRNNTDIPIQSLRVGFHALDKNGDSLYSDEVIFMTDITPGQANWADMWAMYSLDEDINLEEIVSFGFPNYLVLEEDAKLKHEVYNNYSFNDYFKVKVSDISVIHE